ncbi:MAG: hypothetical protein U0573_00815 [Phycisphaerales bacterium]|nr:hypothetical protein [Planctomycetota bacterium]
MRVFLRVVPLICLAGIPQTFAWDAPGHRAITRVGIEGFKAKVTDPSAAWLSETDWSIRIADLATMPDRWRNVKNASVAHINNPDHYIDTEDLVDIGLSLETIEPLRNDFVVQLDHARAEHPGVGRQSNPKLDFAHTDIYPGFLPQAICENYGKLQSDFKTLRTLEKVNDPARKQQVEAVRIAIAAQIGCLAHFVGDAAQPLHTTRHHHGWVGDNPSGFTTKKEFHAQIDAEVLRKHNLYEDAIRKKVRFDSPEFSSIDPANPWVFAISEVKRSNQQLIPLYTLEKSGDLWKEPGAVMITERLADAAGTLSALLVAAWESAAPSDEDIKLFVKYDGFSDAAANKAPK